MNHTAHVKAIFTYVDTSVELDLMSLIVKSGGKSL